MNHTNKKDEEDNWQQDEGGGNVSKEKVDSKD